MDHASAGFTSPWAAAVLSQHAMNPTNIEHGFGHHGLTMDYSYYRCGWDLCFSFSKIIFKLGRVVFFVFLCHTLTLFFSFFDNPKKEVDNNNNQKREASRDWIQISSFVTLVWRNETFFKIIYVMCLHLPYSVVSTIFLSIIFRALSEVWMKCPKHHNRNSSRWWLISSPRQRSIT